jgi:hypothetical protein
MRRRRPSALYSVLDEEQLLDAVDLTDYPVPLVAGGRDERDDELPGAWHDRGFPPGEPADRSGSPGFPAAAGRSDREGDWDEWSPDGEESGDEWSPSGEESGEEWAPGGEESGEAWAPDDLGDPSSPGPGWRGQPSAGGRWSRPRSAGSPAREGGRRRRLTIGLLGALILVVLVARGIGEVLATSGGRSGLGRAAGGPLVGALSAVSHRSGAGRAPAKPRARGRSAAGSAALGTAALRPDVSRAAVSRLGSARRGSSSTAVSDAAASRAAGAGHGGPGQVQSSPHAIGGPASGSSSQSVRPPARGLTGPVRRGGGAGERSRPSGGSIGEREFGFEQ